MEISRADGLNSSAFREHYQDPRAIAFAFLVTAGAKALVLCSEELIDKQVLVSGMEYEAKAKLNATLDEEIRKIQRDLLNGVGIDIRKRARNGRLRHLKLRLKVKNDIEYFVWKSRWGHFQRRFPLCSLKAVQQGDRNGPCRTVRLINDHRFVDFVMNSEAEGKSFLAFCHRILEKPLSICR